MGCAGSGVPFTTLNCNIKVNPFLRGPGGGQMAALTLKEGDVFFLARAGGAVAAPSDGLYRQDTQFVSHYEWRLADRAPATRCSASPEPWRATLDATVEAPLLKLVREVTAVRGGLLDELTIRCCAAARVEVPLVLELGSCFRDIFEVRGMRRDRRGMDLAPRAWKREAVLAYEGLDGLERRLRVHAEPAPDRWEGGTSERPGLPGPGTWLRACWRLSLAPGQTVRVRITLAAERGQERRPKLSPATARGTARAYAAWLREGPTIEVEAAGVQRTLERGLLDLRALLDDVGFGPLPVAGVPWFAVPFGRDSLIAAYQLLHLRPAVAAGTLRTLARLQGQKIDAGREEQPGKIIHELRFGEMANLGEVPFGRYYGSIDSTPLFLVLLGEYWSWTADRPLAEELLPAAEAALAWLERYADLDGDGLVEFAPSGSGLSVQSWKDSADSMAHADGSPAHPPLAVCEVQGYAFDACVRLARVLHDLGRPEAGRRLRRRATALRRAFDRAFWSPRLRYVALALDGAKRRVEVLTSDPGHCLWSGILRRHRAAAVARHLISPRLWSGWGIRTLAEGEARYDPLSYHNGSVWPHDNSLIVMGLKRYGFHEEAAAVAAGLLSAAERFDLQRLPELFGGQPRAAGDPVPYPSACSPQAWAAGAPLLLVRALLGLEADAGGGILRVDPLLPESFGTVRVRTLRVGDCAVDLEARGRVLRVLRVDGPCRVVRGAEPVAPTARRGGRGR